VDDLVARFVPPNSVDEQWDLQGLEQELAVEAGLQLPVTRWPQEAEELDAEMDDYWGAAGGAQAENGNNTAPSAGNTP